MQASQLGRHHGRSAVRRMLYSVAFESQLELVQDKLRCCGFMSPGDERLCLPRKPA